MIYEFNILIFSVKIHAFRFKGKQKSRGFYWELAEVLLQIHERRKDVRENWQNIVALRFPGRHKGHVPQSKEPAFRHPGASIEQRGDTDGHIRWEYNLPSDISIREDVQGFGYE